MARDKKPEEKVLPNDTMFYKCPGEHEIHGGKFDFCIVDANDESAVEAALAEGWHFTTTEAREAYDAEQAANAQHAAQLEGQATGKKGAAPASGASAGTGEGSAPAAAWGGAAPASGKR
jgi:hypothetical protein